MITCIGNAAFGKAFLNELTQQCMNHFADLSLTEYEAPTLHADMPSDTVVLPSAPPAAACSCCCSRSVPLPSFSVAISACKCLCMSHNICYNCHCKNAWACVC